MKTWDSKLVTFLSGGNCVLVKNENEACKLELFARRAGLTLFSRKGEDPIDGYREYCKSSKRYWQSRGIDYTFSDGEALVEFSNHKGLSCGWASDNQCVDWFGIKPYTVSEIEADLEC